MALDDFSDDDSSASSCDDCSLNSDDSFARFATDYFTSDNDHDIIADDNIISWDYDWDQEDVETRERKERAPNRFGYEIGDFMKSNYYYKFLQPSVREQTYIQSRCRFSTFRSRFRAPLTFIDNLTDLFIDREWVTPTKRVKGHKFRVRTQLLIMTSLEHLGNRKPFRQFETDTNMSSTMHSEFFKVFLEWLVEHKDEWIYYPRSMQELRPIIKDYQEQYLPGCGGSIDVVHCKWAHCPAGDNVKSTGKEGFPTLAYECITNNRRKVLSVAPVQFGARNDMHIVRLDPTVQKLRREWYQEVEWEHFDIDGGVHKSKGVYLICDGGYLRWRTLICPYQYEHHGTRKGYFSQHLESVRKDVECTFGILKKRWRILDYGIHYRGIERCEKVFITCCILHNMLIDDYTADDIRTARIGRGAPLGSDAIFLEGPTNRRDRELSLRSLQKRERDEVNDWLARREHLAEHLSFCKRRRG